MNYILTLTESILLSSFLSLFKNSNYGERLMALSEVPSKKRFVADVEPNE